MPRKIKDSVARRKRARQRRKIGVQCGQRVRQGLDLAVLQLLKDCERDFYRLRDAATADTKRPSDPQQLAVQDYLLYLSMLVDLALSATVSLAVHDLARSAYINSRLLLEYAVKAEYAHGNPHYTLWAMTIGERIDYHKRLVNAREPAELIDEARKSVENAKEQYADLHEIANTAQPKPFANITFTDMFVRLAGRKKHTVLYRGPSIYLHGDPIGMREMMRKTPTAVFGQPDISNEELNGYLVDAAVYLLNFCATLQRVFTGTQITGIYSMLEDLQQRTIRVALKYSGGRSPAELTELAAELRHRS